MEYVVRLLAGMKSYWYSVSEDGDTGMYKLYLTDTEAKLPKEPIVSGEFKAIDNADALQIFKGAVYPDLAAKYYMKSVTTEFGGTLSYVPLEASGKLEIRALNVNNKDSLIKDFFKAYAKVSPKIKNIKKMKGDEAVKAYYAVERVVKDLKALSKTLDK